MVIKENDEEDLEFIEEIKDSGIFQLLLRGLKHLVLSILKKKRWLLMIISFVFFLIYKNKVKSGLARMLGY